jgi:hypothetical protein
MTQHVIVILYGEFLSSAFPQEPFENISKVHPNKIILQLVLLY